MRFSARASATPYKGDVKMKKLFCLIITAILLLSCGCSKAEPVEESTASPDLLAYGIYSTTSEENYDTTAPTIQVRSSHKLAINYSRYREAGDFKFEDNQLIFTASSGNVFVFDCIDEKTFAYNAADSNETNEGLNFANGETFVLVKEETK